MVKVLGIHGAHSPLATRLQVGRSAQVLQFACLMKESCSGSCGIRGWSELWVASAPLPAYENHLGCN